MLSFMTAFVIATAVLCIPAVVFMYTDAKSKQGLGCRQRERRYEKMAAERAYDDRQRELARRRG